MKPLCLSIQLIYIFTFICRTGWFSKGGHAILLRPVEGKYDRMLVSSVDVPLN